MKVMVASKMCEPADTLEEETEFDSNMIETKPKTSNKRRKITYYTVSILGVAAIVITAFFLFMQQETLHGRSRTGRKKLPMF